MPNPIPDILKSLLPTVATALGGPLAGAAAAWIATKVGASSDTAESISDAVRGIDPLEREKLEQEFNRWFIEQQQKELETIIKDVQDARARDTVFLTSGTRNYRADALVFLCAIVVFVITYLVWSRPEINEYVKGIFTLILGRFLGYLDNIFNFEFGTTRASRSKDATIKTLTDRNS